MPGLWVQAKQRVRKQAVLSAKLERHTRAYKCTSFTEKLLPLWRIQRLPWDPPTNVLQQVPIGVKEEDCSAKGEAHIQVLTEAVWLVSDGCKVWIDLAIVIYLFTTCTPRLSIRKDGPNTGHILETAEIVEPLPPIIKIDPPPPPQCS